MDLAALRDLRLRTQGLRHPPDASAAESVRRFVAVQAQEFLPAQWGLAQRVPLESRPDAASTLADLDAGRILRTHVLRPTWHFLHPDDARWVIRLSAERVHRANGSMYRSTGVEGEVAARAVDLVAEAVAGRHRTRAELATMLADAGLPSSGVPMVYVLMRAELECLIISGANAGKQRTYAAFDERVPASAPRDRADALAELAARYVAARGPVTERDFASWSGFTLADTRRAFADAIERADAAGRPITTVDVDGVDHLVDARALDPEARGGEDATDAAEPRVDLLQAYDEYIMGYAPPRAYLHRVGDEGLHAEFPLHAFMVDGIMVGRWAPPVASGRPTVRIVPWRPLAPAEERGLAASVAEFERFFGTGVAVEVTVDSREGSAVQ
ncbi:winged helix DNA-binding domain-containing protein [Agromyces salentinus]|uniref:Winged helix DNA-binding domain-containing protein n=1 Tax=Agromyces salentinus TaxID=269421 RepID=A0ABN2MW15_9MICO|nr:winged helix DNA-binding domain-containing protein [Agromyces salentinus]